MKPLLLTVGNIYIDHNVFGVNAGEVFRLESGKDYFAGTSERVLGGSAVNAALQAKRLNLDVGFIGKTGTDSGAEEVRHLLDSQGIISDLVGEDSAHFTSMAINLIDKDGEFIGVHYGNASKTLAAEDVDMGHHLLKRCSAIYFGGTAKQPILFGKCKELFGELGSRGIKVFYDPNRFPAHEALMDRSLLHDQLAFVEGYFPNEEELLQATGKTDIDEALNQILNTGVAFVALKRGAKGCRIKTKDDDFVVEGKSVSVVSTVGAGDCFNATFITYYLQGASLKECAERATAAAAIKVSRNIWPDRAAIEKQDQ
ncbi:carbohydrate kinase family protein [Candidatus Saccharibacteria bacterium]|nr:MAG: carbohydrate kinase family protein [Candidatus Saccharibacteria bacterium]